MARKELLIAHTGKGKGKTTAALGLAYRMFGQNEMREAKHPFHNGIKAEKRIEF